MIDHDERAQKTASPQREVSVVVPRSVERAIVPRSVALPPPPPGCRYVQVLGLGVVIADDDLRKRIDRRFHLPMILLALLVLPLLLLDFYYIRETPAAGGPTRSWLWWLVIGGLTLIWIAFTLEFCVKIAIAEHRGEYLKRNWLDLIIIVIPLLRPLRVAALARTTQTFRLRGVGFKLARYVFTLFVGMKASDRILERLGMTAKSTRTPPEEMTRHALMTEVAKLRKLSDDWTRWHAQQQKFLAEHGRAPMSDDQPRESPASSAQS